MITCAINDVEIVKALYADITAALKAAPKDQTFDHMGYMKNLYKDLAEQGSPEVAAKYLQSVPRLILHAQITYFEDIEVDSSLQKLNREFKAEDGIDTIIKSLSEQPDLSEQKTRIRVENQLKNELDEIPVGKEATVRVPERFKTLSPWGGTLQTYISIKPSEQGKVSIKVEDINPEKMHMVKTFERIKEVQAMSDPTDGITLDGKKLMFRAYNLNTFATGNNFARLDSETQNQIVLSRDIKAKGKKVSADIAQVDQRVILVLSDEFGMPVYFDANGNVTDGDTGKLVYQFMRTVRKEGNTYTVKDIYNKEDQVISPQEFARMTYDPEIDGTKKEYFDKVVKMQQDEMKSLYELQEKALKNEAPLLPVTNVSTGIPSNMSSTEVSLNELIKFPGISENILGTIKTAPKKGQSIESGQATIVINGNKFAIDRPHIPEDIANEIATILTDPSISIEAKKKFTDQFIPSTLDKKGATKKYSLFYSPDGKYIYFNVYENFGLKNQIKDKSLNLTPEVYGKKSLEERAVDKERIIEYLTKMGLNSQGGQTFMSFNNAALSSRTYLRLSPTGKGFVSANYFDLLKSVDSKVALINADPGFYNYVVNYTTPDTLLGDVINNKRDLFAEGLTEIEERERKNEPLKEATAIIDESKSDYWRSIVTNDPQTKVKTPNDAYLAVAYFINQVALDRYKDKTFAQEVADNVIAGFSYKAIGEAQIGLMNSAIERKFPDVAPSKNITDSEVKTILTEPGAESPASTDSPVSKIFKSNGDIDLNDIPGLDELYRRGIKKEFINPIKIRQAKKWWNSKELEPLRKLIQFDHMANIVNSDVYARFVVAGATLADTGTFGTISVNKANGNFYQNLTVYHEAWHAFSQLFLTKEQKTSLYNELKDYTDKSGKKPYAEMSFRELEEMLAEDFRNYVKTGKAKAGAPKRNSIFRTILDFLKQIFGKLLGKFQKQSIQIDSLNSPMAKELFDNLYLGKFNSYTASIDNALLYELDRGPLQVANSKEDALSPQDGLLVTNSIDSIFSEIIDDIYKTRVLQSKKEALEEVKKTGVAELTQEMLEKAMLGKSLKSASIVMLADPSKRAWMYQKAKERIEVALEQEEAKLEEIKGIVDVNDITTLEDLKKNAVAVMKHESGQDKYFFLSSQVSNFSNLSPSLKRGQRVRGEEYRDSIKIVGDFYKHNAVKKGKRQADIVIISRLEDAEIQFQHYLKGGAQVYTKLQYTGNEAPVYLSEEQELVRDNIRILQKTLENWGDEKSGIVKYHMENTDYEIAKSKFDFAINTDLKLNEDGDLIDENGEVIDEAENNGLLENNNDLLVGKLSLQQMMSKETTYLIKSLFKVNPDGSTPKNRLGFKERADFAKVFSILARTIGGERDRYKAYEKLRVESAKFPELKQLFESKYPDPANITNTFEYDISRQFLQDFGKPRVKYMQLFAFTENNALDFQVKESSVSIDNTINRWSNGFLSSAKTDYISKSRDNVSTLNLQNVVKDFGVKDELNTKKQIEFARAIGIDIENNDNIKTELDDKVEYYGLPYIFDVVKYFNQIEELQTSEPNSKFITTERLKYLNKFKANPIDVLREGIPAGVLSSMKGTVKELTQLKRLAELQTKYGYDSATTAVIRANGNMGYQEMNWSTAHAKAYALNEVTDMMQLWTDPRYNYMSYLNPNINPHTRHLKVINSMFDASNKKIPGKSIQIIAADGFSVLNSDGTTEGNTTTELDPYSKFVHELHTMLLGGFAEFPRHSEKKFSYGMKLMGGIETDPVGFITKGSDKNLYIDANMFRPGGNGEIFAIGSYLFGYIQGEFDRIKLFRGPKRDEYLKITGYNYVVDKVDGKDIYAGEVFTAFDDILTPETKNALYELADQQIDVDLVNYLEGNPLKKQIVNELKNYFNTKSQELIDLYYNKFGYLSKSMFEKMGYREDELTEDKLKELRANSDVLKQVIKAYSYNDWIHKYETSILMYGDHAQWNHDKEDWSKRIPGLTSDGTGFLFDAGTIDFVNEVFNKTTYASIQAEQTGKDYNKFVLSEKINTAIIKDAVRESIYLDDMVEAWQEEYSQVYPEATVKKLIANDKDAYLKMKEGDGMAYMTLDAYRTLHKIGRGWTLAQESLYQKIIKGETVDPKTVKDYFPVYKLHYFGAIANDLLPATAMHKFAVIPLIPGVNAKEGSQLDVLHKKMLEENVQYVTFDSGSKGANITSDRKVDDIFKEKDKAINNDVKFTLNPIYLANLKEVTVINEHFKGKLPIATQTRGIVIDNLYKDGKLVNSKNEEVVSEYNNSVKDYTAILKEELLNDVGFELIDGRYVGNITEFVELIRRELKQRDTPEHLVKLINTTWQKQLAMDLSLHPESDSIEKLLMSFIQNGLIKQKTKGEPLVQTPTTFTNGLWDSPFKAVTDLKEIKKLLGTNTLAFYLRNKNARSTEMKVVIALQGDYVNLLKGKDLEGNEIGSIDRLNELIKNPEWFEKNKKSLTLFGPRIPNDATNTIEAATVWHFLPESFGNSIIVPTEIVAKAGSDFDGDKLFMSMANISSDGEYINEGIKDFEKVLKETKKLESENKLPEDRLTSRQLISIQKKYLQNRYKDAAVEILMLPENYAYLTKPNGTYLVDIYVKDLEKNKTGYDKYKTVTTPEPKKSAPNAEGKRKTVMSPTRTFEQIHNLYVHDANLSLEPSLGILAKLSKSHPIYKSVGAKMPATYRLTSFVSGLNKTVETGLEIPMIMRFKHNVVTNSKGQEVISLAGERTQKGTRISDLISHNLQGVLDRAKATFPFDLKLVPEAMDVLSYMIQAGVDEQQIFLFLNHPTVVDYFENQRLMKSSIYNVVNKTTPVSVKNKAASQVIENVFENIPEETKAELLNRISANKLRATLATLKTNPTLPLFYIVNGVKGVNNTTVEGLIEMLNSKVLKPSDISILSTSSSLKEDKVYSPTYKINSSEDYAFAADTLSKTFIPGNEVTIDVLKKALSSNDRSSLEALAIFMNFIELEKQFSGMKELQSAFSPDTAKLTTVQQAMKRLQKYEQLKSYSTIDQEFLNRLLNESVISSFNQDNVMVDLAEKLFQLKLNPTITGYIDRTLSDMDLSKMIKKKFGKGVDGEERFTNAFNNAVINFIYQNYMSNFYDAKGEFVNIPEQYKGMPVIVNDDIAFDAIVVEEGIAINSKRIEEDYATKAYLTASSSPNSYESQGLDSFKISQDPFKTLSSYYRYVIARESIRVNNPIESIEDSPYFKNKVTQLEDANAAYESYISERALAASFNPSYILGKTKYSYTTALLEMIDKMSDTLKAKYTILNQLSPTPNTEGVRILRLNNRKEAQGALADDYYKQIRDLADVTVIKTDNPFENKRISEMFGMFSLMMYYQHGVGKSSTGFVKVLDPSQYKAIITSASQAFLANYANNSTLDTILNTVLSPLRFKDHVIKTDNFKHASAENLAENFTDEVVEEFDFEEGEKPVFEKGERIISQDDVNLYLAALKKAKGEKPNRWFTSKTTFAAFYNTNTGKREPMPQSTIWMLNSNGLYDLVDQDPDSGEIYYENVDLATGIQMIEPGKAPTQPTAPKQVTSINQNDTTISVKERLVILEQELKDALEEQAILEENSVAVIVANNMPKITPESAKKETGGMTGIGRDISISLLSNDGMTVQQAAHYINEGEFYEEAGRPPTDEQEIREHIINILLKGKAKFLEEQLNYERTERLKNEIAELKRGLSVIKNKTIEEDIAFYDQLVKEANGQQPKQFEVGRRKWILNIYGNYDLVDSNTGDIYMRNISMETGQQEQEPGLNDPINPEFINFQLNQLLSMREPLNLDQQLADIGYDINDIIDNLAKAKTVEDYIKVKEILNKLC